MDLVERLGECISKDDMETIIEACEEIERLRAEVAAVRAATIEECAKELERVSKYSCADDIRALKEGS